MPPPASTRIEELESSVSFDSSGCGSVDEARSPLLHDPPSCPALPTQQSIRPISADDAAPSGATVIRNDAATIDARNTRATSAARVCIQNCFGSDITRSGALEESTSMH